MHESTRSTLDRLRLRVMERWEAARTEHPELRGAVESVAEIAQSLPDVWLCSQFVAESCLRHPKLLSEFAANGELLASIGIERFRQELAAIDRQCESAEVHARLRSFRRRHMVRIAWRDLAGWADLRETLASLSDLADACIEFAHRRAFAELTSRYGVPRGTSRGTSGGTSRSTQSDGEQQMLILGMGKLGGRELNYSSDIDLVFLYPEDGVTDGERSVENAEFFLRLGQRIISLLAEKTVDGFVYRVDMRLRPFGDSGRMAISFDSFEEYLQQHGRDWERYAYVKARAIVGSASSVLYDTLLRPFVYRRYLDFGVFESLRNMKELIAREVARRELQDNVKLGPGGIREIEFIVQAFQLIRGGSDRRLQTRELRTALPLLAGQKLLPPNVVADLSAAYEFLRRLENRLQEYNDEQTHQLPGDEEGRVRLAFAMGCAEWEALVAQLDAHRAAVARHFANVVFGPQEGSARLDASEFNLEGAREDWAQCLSGLSDEQQQACSTQLEILRDSGYYRRLDETGRRRLQALMPRLLALAKRQAAPEVALSRVLRIIEMIGGRTAYLALLHESGIALQRLVDLCARSGFLAEQIATFPLLLDELIDERLFETVPSREQMQGDLSARMQSVRDDDVDLQIEALRQVQRAAMFRIAVADFSGQLPLMKISDRLTDLAELIVEETLSIAWRQIAARHGEPECGSAPDKLRRARVIVVAYGKLGGIELGYGSDLDLVFLHDSGGEIQMTNGPQSVENSVFFARVGQRLVHLLTTYTRAGRLYEVDIRLRPSGKGGLLVQTLRAFEDYQRKEAWTWEHQALLRARAVAGDAGLRAEFEALRIDVLRHAVRRDSLRDEVRKMRERMRAELSKAKPGQFDLKQDAGGIADLEFLTQYWMLKWCDQYPPIITFSDNIRQLESLASGAIVAQETVDFLTDTYRKYRQRMHHLSLAGGEDLIADSEFAEDRRKLIELWNSQMQQL